MTIEDISNTLPNGFHDSDLVRFSVDFENETAQLVFDIDVSDAETGTDFKPKRAVLNLIGLLYFVLEPPSVEFSEKYVASPNRQSVSSDSSSLNELVPKPRLPERLPQGAFRHWFYLANDNNFIHVAAMDSRFEWTEISR